MSSGGWARLKLRELGAIEYCGVVSVEQRRFPFFSLCVGGRTLYRRFDLGDLFYEPVALPFCQYFAIVISSAKLGSSLCFVTIVCRSLRNWHRSGGMYGWLWISKAIAR